MSGEEVAKRPDTHATQLTFNSLFSFSRMVDCNNNILLLHNLTMKHSKLFNCPKNYTTEPKNIY